VGMLLRLGGYREGGGGYREGGGGYREGGGGNAKAEAAESETDLLMGCVVASFCGARTQTAALAAAAECFTRSGKLSQAVPLLFLIGRGRDACRLLQGAGQWERAAVLAKASLPATERGAILFRWAEHLHARGDTQRSIEVLISLGRVQEVAERLLEAAAYDKAALLILSLREAYEARRGEIAGFAFRGAARVLLEYAAFLSRLSLHTYAIGYTSLACATADLFAKTAASGSGLGSCGASSASASDALLTEIEAAQLVQQLSRLQALAEDSAG